MAPVTRLLARDHAPGAPQQQDENLILGTAKSAKIRKRPKPEKSDKQHTTPGLERLQALEVVNQREAPPAESIPDNLDTAQPDLPPSERDREMVDQTLPVQPEPQSPDEQLNHGLTNHVSTLLQARASKEKQEDKEILEILSLLDKKVSSMKQEELPRACSFGKALRTFVCNYFTQHSPGKTVQNQHLTPLPAPAGPHSYATAFKASNPETKTTKKAHTAPSKPERPLRLFLRLPAEHPARHASPHAALQKLRSSLDPVVTATIKEIQHIPTGLAIGPKDTQSAQILLNKKEEIQQIIQGSNAEAEQKWAIFVIPGATKQYTGYEGSAVTVSEKAAKEEFELQTGTSPLKLHWSRKRHVSNTDNSATIILAVPEGAASRIPRWIHFFGKNLRVVRKFINPKVHQCARCWDYHNPRSCTRRPKCRLCGDKDHTEEDHKGSTQRCANCLGPAPADHAQCHVRPSIKQGVLVRVPKTQVAAIRRIGSNRQHTPPSENAEADIQKSQTDTDSSAVNTVVEAGSGLASPQ